MSILRALLFTVLLTTSLGLLLACSSNAPEQPTSTATAAPAASTVDTLPPSTAPSTEFATPVREETTLNPAQTPPTTDQALTLRMGTLTAEAGQEVCLPIVADNFTQLIGLQYTMRWDSSQLVYTGVRNITLPGLRPNNFGDRFKERGYLAVSWIDDRLTGVTLPAAAHLYDVCFKITPQARAPIEVKFANGPTTFEVIDYQENIWRLRYANGQIRLQ